jgi:hypothetical protein
MDMPPHSDRESDAPVTLMPRWSVRHVRVIAQVQVIEHEEIGLRLISRRHRLHFPLTPCYETIMRKTAKTSSKKPGSANKSKRVGRTGPFAHIKIAKQAVQPTNLTMKEIRDAVRSVVKAKRT